MCSWSRKFRLEWNFLFNHRWASRFFNSATEPRNFLINRIKASHVTIAWGKFVRTASEACEKVRKYFAALRLTSRVWLRNFHQSRQRAKSTRVCWVSRALLWCFSKKLPLERKIFVVWFEKNLTKIYSQNPRSWSRLRPLKIAFCGPKILARVPSRMRASDESIQGWKL